MATNAKAPTQKEMFSAFIKFFNENGAPASFAEFCNERIAKLEKKATSANSKKNAEDEKFFDLIAEVLADGAPKRATEIFKAIESEVEGLTIQKVTAMLKKMVDGGRATKTIEKKVSMFALNFGVEGE